MTANKKAAIIAALVSLAGCGATPYQPMAFKGGYRDTHIKDNIYFVEIATNAYTTQSTAAQYFHRRAQEVCTENGYRDYEMQGQRDTSTQFATGTYGAGSLTATSMNKPGFSGYVECKK